MADQAGPEAPEPVASPLERQASKEFVQANKRFGGKLSKEGRDYVGFGLLAKVCRKQAKPRVFLLCNDALVYATMLMESKYTKPNVLPLDQLTLVNLEDNPPLTNAWQFTTNKKSFTVFAPDAETKKRWFEHLEASIGRPAVSLDDPSLGTKAPTWVPDSSVTYCMHCHRLGIKKKFGKLVRKHHCRMCGDVVCNPCSSKRYHLPEQNAKKPVRVCDACYLQLVKKGIQGGRRVHSQEYEEDEDDADNETAGIPLPDHINSLTQVDNIDAMLESLASMSQSQPTHFFDDPEPEPEPEPEPVVEEKAEEEVDQHVEEQEQVEEPTPTPALAPVSAEDTATEEETSPASDVGNEKPPWEEEEEEEETAAVAKESRDPGTAAKKRAAKAEARAAGKKLADEILGARFVNQPSDDSDFTSDEDAGD